MTTAAKLAFGTTLKKGEVAIAEIKSMSGPTISVDTVDVTSHDSPYGYKEVLQGLRDAGEISIGGNFIPGNAGQIALKTDLDDGSLDAYTITFPVAMATTCTFSAIVTAFELDEPFDAEATFTATLKISGKATLNVTESTGLTTPFFAISESAVIVPDPANDTYLYIATVATGIESVTVTPTAADGVIKVNGSVYASAAPATITLGDAETNTEVTITVQETNKTVVTYTIWICRAAAA